MHRCQKAQRGGDSYQQSDRYLLFCSDAVSKRNLIWTPTLSAISFRHPGDSVMHPWKISLQIFTESVFSDTEKCAGKGQRRNSACSG